jgi:hypothetical protein
MRPSFLLCSLAIVNYVHTVEANRSLSPGALLPLEKAFTQRPGLHDSSTIRLFSSVIPRGGASMVPLKKDLSIAPVTSRAQVSSTSARPHRVQIGFFGIVEIVGTFFLRLVYLFHCFLYFGGLLTN